jgi:hypothetical protein
VVIPRAIIPPTTTPTTPPPTTPVRPPKTTPETIMPVAGPIPPPSVAFEVAKQRGWGLTVLIVVLAGGGTGAAVRSRNRTR